jgi:hypothetical protein
MTGPAYLLIKHDLETSLDQSRCAGWTLLKLYVQVQVQSLELHFTPLNLHPDDSKPLSHLNEASSSQCLGQNVS